MSCKSEGMTFEEWKKDVELLFNVEYGMGMDDFPDYNWFDEWDNDVVPGESFDEWKCMTEAGVIG